MTSAMTPCACIVSPQPFEYTTVDKKGRDKEVEVHLDERDPVFTKIRGLELVQVTAVIEADTKQRREKEAVAEKKVR